RLSLSSSFFLLILFKVLKTFPLSLQKINSVEKSMWKNVLLVFSGACSFGILSSFVKIAYSEGYTVGEVTGVQVFFGMAVLWIIYGTGRTLGFFDKNKGKKEPFWKLLLSGLSTG